LTEVTITVDYLAGYVRIAKQMLQDLPFMQNYVNSALIEDYLRTEDNAFFGQLYSAATGSTTTSGANTAEKIIDIMAAIEEADHEVNGIVVSGAIWAAILKTNLGSGAGYGVPGGITIGPTGDVQLIGIPLVKTPASNLGNSKVLLGDFTKAKIIQAEGLNVSMSEHDQDNFIRNLITVKCEARVALAILRPDAFSYFTS
jgi:HK97 family phage major capsid protein